MVITRIRNLKTNTSHIKASSHLTLEQLTDLNRARVVASTSQEEEVGFPLVAAVLLLMVKEILEEAVEVAKVAISLQRAVLGTSTSISLTL
jgi:hypothetical protein